MLIVKKTNVLIFLVLSAVGFGGCGKDTQPDIQSPEDQTLVGRWELVRMLGHTYENDEHVSTSDSEVDEDYSVDREMWMKGLVFKPNKRVVMLFNNSDTGGEERYQYQKNEFDYYLTTNTKKLYINEADFVDNEGVYEIITLSQGEMHLSTSSFQRYGPENLTRFVTEYYYKKKDIP